MGDELDESKMENHIGNVSQVSDFPKSESVSTKKQPPPESAENVRVRSLVILSFWAIVVFLGIPTWWWTTSIHRAHLPLREMLEWADGKVYPFGLDVRWLPGFLLMFKSLGLQTVFSLANRYRSALTARERSSASGQNHAACSRRLE